MHPALLLYSQSKTEFTRSNREARTLFLSRPKADHFLPRQSEPGRKCSLEICLLSLYQRCHRLLGQMTPLLHFQTGGTFKSSLITSFLVFICTAYNFFLVCGQECILRTLYPVKHTGNCRDHPVSVPWSSVETCRTSTDCVSGLLCAVIAGIYEIG